MPKQSAKRRTSAHDDYPKYLSIETLHSAHRSKDAKHTRGIPTAQSIHRYERAKIHEQPQALEVVIEQDKDNSNNNNATISSDESNSDESPSPDAIHDPGSHSKRRGRKKLSTTGDKKDHLPTKSFLPILSKQHHDIGHIKKVQIGKFLMDVWYVAPYPEEYSRLETLYVCEFCLKYMKSRYIAKRHKVKCPMKYPPGNEIYRDGQLSVFEVDGKKNKMYCQNLCLLAKMFLDHKTLYYDVEPFLFYILTEANQTGCQFVGYFSKEKKSLLNYNLSCIMTLPSYQRNGYGQFLIDFSKEGKTGSPEKPLSDLGLLSYRKYWINSIKKFLKEHPARTSIEDISKETCITVNDIIATLEYNRMLRKNKQGQYEIIMNEKNDQPIRNYVKSELLIWVPYLVTKQGGADTLKKPREIQQQQNHSLLSLSSSSLSSELSSPSN
ncbi:hypothetical protein BCV71DRAFT_264308 [Rhizopus microsporus]|uniref:Histone acetyltransferase n=1 Tax=Rhizopus microsporus TaxID=58291 RepID=A0A1X0S0Z2_RHIZD|nr:hypothetical protein BCV71DRAFT_264308 [Rhizopus microsporus]